MPRWARVMGESQDGRGFRPGWGLVTILGVIVFVIVIVTSGGDAPGVHGAKRGPERPGRATAVSEVAPEARGERPAPGAPATRAGAIVMPGGTVKGTVRWESGTPVAGAAVALVDEEGELVGEVLTDAAGHYAIEDEALAGRELQITEPLGAAHERDLAPLRTGETRSLDVVLGGAREVVGWVLDPSGEPLPGVPVTLSWERAAARWHALTDAGGGFVFVDAPETPVRVTADGGDLGIASARVAQSDAMRREVTLVLEPTGTIVVSANPEVVALGQVTVRCYSAGAHGEDGLWNDDLRAPDYDFEHLEEEGHLDYPPIDEELAASPPEPVQPEPVVAEVEAMIAVALSGWDTGDPEGSLTRMALDLARMDPGMEREIRSDVERAFPELAGQPLEAVARAAAQKVIDEEPRILDMMGVAASHVQAGVAPLEAFMRAEQELRPGWDATVGHQVEAPPAAAAVEIEAVGEEVDPVDDEAAMADGAYDEGLVAPDIAIDDDHVDFDQLELMERLEALRERTGIDEIEVADEPRSIVATGAFFQPIPVRGAFEYRVSIVHPEGLEIVCGSVFVAPGDEVEVRCGGGGGPAILEGRVVDARGAPVAGAEVGVFPSIYADWVRATTDHHGRYRLEVEVTGAQLVTVVAETPTADGATHASAQRRQQNARSGVLTEVPDLVLRSYADLVDYSNPAPFGGVGASIGLGTEGIVLQSLVEDGPLAMSGAEEGDVIVRIGEEVGASLSADDAVMMLRGEVGTAVDLTLRSAAGELYELLLTRGLVTPPQPPRID